MDCGPPGSSVHGIFQVRIPGWVALSSFRGSPQLRDWTCISCVSCVSRWILYDCATWEAPLPSTGKYKYQVLNPLCWYLTAFLLGWDKNVYMFTVMSFSLNSMRSIFLCCPKLWFESTIFNGCLSSMWIHHVCSGTALLFNVLITYPSIWLYQVLVGACRIFHFCGGIKDF